MLHARMKRGPGRLSGTSLVCLALGIMVAMGLTLTVHAPAAKAAGPAVLYATPATGSYPVGGTTFAVQVRLDTKGTYVNAVQAYLTFPVDLLEVVGTPDTTGSFLQYWMPEVSVDNTTGLVRLAAGVPSGFDSGFTGDGLVATITFRTRATMGTATIGFDAPNCAALASSDNSDVLGQMIPATRTVNNVGQGTFRPTGATKIMGDRVVMAYDLVDDQVHVVPLTSAIVDSMAVTYPSGVTTAYPYALDDTTGFLWGNVLTTPGTYHISVILKPVGGVAVAYEGDILWQPLADLFAVSGSWVKRSGQMYIPYSCVMDVSGAEALYAIKSTGGTPISVPVTGEPALYVPISASPGSYVVVIADGNTCTVAPLVLARTGDLNHDGVIDIFDASALMAAWGTAAPTQEADINGDLVVDIFDVSFEIAHWTPRP